MNVESLNEKKTVLLYSKRKKKYIQKLKNILVSSLINALFVVLCGSVIFKKERVNATGQRKIIYVSFFRCAVVLKSRSLLWLVWFVQ